MKNKILCVLTLTIIILISVVPIMTYAVNIDKIETNNPNELNSGTDNLVIEGSNSVGKLITTELNAETEEQQKNNGYNIFSIKLENNIATVEFETQKEATIVVGVYDENGMQLKTSGTAKISKEDTQTLIELEQSEIPTYFKLKVFMLDSNMSPLCSSYESSYYTKDMQDFLQKTTDDFAQEKVLNLDNDKTTNYAIYNNQTKIIKQSNNNVIKSIDETNSTYIFENIDNSISSLQIGDVFSYEYTNGEVLIVKVSKINIDGSTATINRAKIENIEEVFDYIKIEGEAATEDCEVEDIHEEGVTYNGLAGNTARKARNASSEGSSISRAHSFSINKEIKNDKENKTITFAGEIEHKVELGCTYYKTEQNTVIEVKLTSELKVGISVSGEIKASIPITKFYAPIIPGLITAEFDTSLVAEVSCEIGINGTLETVIGYRAESGELKNISSKPKWNNNGIISGEVNIFIGLGIELKVNIISDDLISAGLEGKAGAEFSTEFQKEEDTDTTKHLCKKCIQGEINGILEILIKGNIGALEGKHTFSASIKLSDFYYSIDNNKFGFTKCPYKSYKILIIVKNQKSQALRAVKITGNDITGELLTDRDGIATCYLKNGSYELTASKDNVSKTVTIQVNNGITVQDIGLEVNNTPIINDDIDITNETEVKTGKCGDNVRWTLYSSGLLYIEGNGKTYDYNHVNVNNTPWKDDLDKVTKVKIGKGITEIGDGLFYQTENLTNVIISDDVQNIGIGAFYRTKLKKVYIPEGVKTIEGSAFADCYELTEVSMPSTLRELGGTAFAHDAKLRSVEIPEGITRINDNTFFECYGLQKVIIPDTVTSIGIQAFSECENVTNITIPNSVTSIEPSAFSGCTALSTIVIPNSVTKIYSGIFEYCENLKNVTLSNSIEEIPANTFKQCKQLTSVTIADNVKIIGKQAFSECKSLKTITIPSNVKTIGEGAFYQCTALSDIYFKGNKPDVMIESEQGQHYEIFADVTANVHYPSSWSSVIADCGGKITWLPYNPNTTKTSNVNNNLLTSLANSEDKKIMKLAEITENNEQTVNYTNLLPNKEYIFVAIKHKDIKDILLSSNLLYIAQIKTDTNGNINFTYIPRELEQNAITMIYGPTKPLKISLLQNNITMQQGESRNLIALVQPENAIDSEFSWSSSNESVVKVDQNGKATAVGSGKTEIIVETKNGLTAMCSVTVETPKKLINTMNVTLSSNSFVYTGGQIVPTVTIKESNGTLLRKNIDYTVSYKNNINVGTATVLITGKGNYEGNTKATFKINSKNINSCVIANIGNKTYTKESIKPTISVKNGKNTLRNGTDYTVSYKNNKNLGTATVTITGKGNYNGSVNKTFKIVLPTVSGVKASSQTTSSITVKWNKPSGAITGYEVYMASSKNGKYKKVATITKNKTTSYKKTKLSAGKTYYFKVRAYTTISGKKRYGNYSTILSTATKTKAPKISKITAGKKKATIKWKKISGASGYEVYMATSKKGKYSKVTTIKKNSTTSYTKTKLKKGKNVYFKIRTYKTGGDKKIYSSYSSIKNVKVK